MNSAINIARTGLSTSQLGLQVTSNNIANASTPGYSRQILQRQSMPGGGNIPQLSIGMGVQVSRVQRQVDQGILTRLWSTTSDQASAQTFLRMQGQIEAALGELGDNDLSTQLSGFFRAWSERANQTQSSASVIQKGEALAGFLRRVRSDVAAQLGTGELELAGMVSKANQLLEQIARANQAISDAEVANQQANVLRDQRDQYITQLSELVPVTVVDRGMGGADVLVGSIPVVLGSQSRGLELAREPLADGTTRPRLRTRSDSSTLDVSTGSIGALLVGSDQSIRNTLSSLDTIARELIWEVNRIHSTATTPEGYESLTATLPMALDDRSRALSDPANASLSAFPFAARSGSFVVRVQNEASGAISEHRITIDLDGINALGQPGAEDDTSLDDIVAALDAIDGIGASVDPDGRLVVAGDPGSRLSFAEDSSDVLALLGMNAYFTGTSAADIAVRPDLSRDPLLLGAGRLERRSGELQLVENGAALALSALQDRGLASLGGQTIAGAWRDAVQRVGSSVAQALSSAEAASVVRESLETQRQAVSGVSLDEEAINLLEFQRAYQASARVITVADEMIQELLALA